MTESEPMVTISILAFGQLSERLGGREHTRQVPTESTVRTLLKSLDLTEWITFGLTVAINGERCSVDTRLNANDEVALLPPVSGG